MSWYERYSLTPATAWSHHYQRTIQGENNLRKSLVQPLAQAGVSQRSDHIAPCFMQLESRKLTQMKLAPLGNLCLCLTVLTVK